LYYLNQLLVKNELLNKMIDKINHDLIIKRLKIINIIIYNEILEMV
jgi:hypothetical protein